QRDVKGITETHEAGCLGRGVDIKGSRQVVGLVGDDSDRTAIQTPEANDDVRSEQRLDLGEILLSQDDGNNVLNVIGCVGIDWDNVAQAFVAAVNRVSAGPAWWIFGIVL